MTNRFGFPNLGFGLGLRAAHYDNVLGGRSKRPDWLEIISENYLDAHSGYRQLLADLRQDYRFVMHGVSLSIGSTDPLNRDYLRRLKSLADFLQPAWVSDHLCFTGVQGKNTHDLLPIPYTEEALRHISARIKVVQEILERPLVLENPSSYVMFAGSTLGEAEFLANLAEEADCGLLLDVNNVYVSAYNHGWDAQAYIDTIPTERIVQIHLAGHRDKSGYKIDTHDQPVPDAVWELYAYSVARKGPISTLVEWDEQIPEFEVLLAELEKARQCARSACETDAA